MMFRISLVGIFLALAAFAAVAQTSTTFRSPSSNIICSFYTFGETAVRCDIINRNSKKPILPVPADCDLGWGNMFVVSSDGPGRLECAGDLAGNFEDSFPLKYGDEITEHGITCSSAETGMTCTNKVGQGFSISRAAQKLF
jgi:hypothetical protein